MTLAMTFSHTGTGLRDRIETVIADLAERRARRARFARTLTDLQSASDRDLADIGISRLVIREVAYETAYGNQK